jgi:hypothetical protein
MSAKSWRMLALSWRIWLRSLWMLFQSCDAVDPCWPELLEFPDLPDHE